MAQEHAIPKWLSKAGKRNDNDYYQRVRNDKTIRTKLIEIKTRRICEDCNTGWLSRIELSAKAAVEPLLGNERRIGEADRWVIARWFTKTVLTTQLAIMPRTQQGPITTDTYQQFYDNPKPPNSLILFMSAYAGPVQPIRYIAVLSERDDHLRVLFHFQHIVFYGLFVIGDSTALYVPGGFLDATYVIWPTTRGFLNNDDPTISFKWPPKFSLGPDFIDKLIDTVVPEF